MSEKQIRTLQEQISAFNDQDAFKQLFRYFYNGLLQFAISIIHHKEPAEEIVEDQFIAIWNRRASLTYITNLKLYLYISVRNRCFNHIKRNKHHFGPLHADDLEVQHSEADSNPENIMMIAELANTIQKAIFELPPKCREVYKLVKEDGLSYKEVAEILEISPRTVENHIATAVRKLATSLNIDLSAYRKSSILPS